LRYYNPNCPLFYLIGGYLARENGRVKEAMERFELFERRSKGFAPLHLIAHYEIGWTFFVLNEFVQAIPFFEKFL